MTPKSLLPVELEASLEIERQRATANPEVEALKKALFQMQNAAIELTQKLIRAELHQKTATEAAHALLAERDGAIAEAAAAKRDRSIERVNLAQALIAAVRDEREACARVAEAGIIPEHQGGGKSINGANHARQQIAAAIRARGGA